MSDQLGEDHVLPSIRLAQIRDCVEDYEWLKLAAGEPGGFLNSSHSVSQNRVMLSWPFWYNGIVMKTENDTRYKWVMLALLAFTYFLMHATRQIFNASLPDIKLSLPGTSDAQWGFTRTAFLFAYGLAVPLAGIAADMLRRKWVVVLGAFLFSASVLGTGFVDGFVGMLVMYGLMNGIGQCMIPASASSLIAQYHHETRSTALSIYQSGLYVGIIVASALAGVFGAMSSDGWRYAFWIFGAIGVAWTFALVFLLRDTPPLLQNHRAGELERASFKEAALAMVSKPTAVLLTFAFGMLVFGSNCFRTFLPLFMRQDPELGGFALSSASAALHSVVWFYIGSFIGIGTGARLSDRLAHKFPAIRINMMIVGLALSAPTMAKPAALLLHDVPLRPRWRLLRLLALLGALRGRRSALSRRGDGRLPLRRVPHRMSRDRGPRLCRPALLIPARYRHVRRDLRHRRDCRSRSARVLLQPRPR